MVGFDLGIPGVGSDDHGLTLHYICGCHQQTKSWLSFPIW